MNGRLNEAQLELLKAFSVPMTDEELDEFRKWILEFKVRKLQQHMDEVWEKRGIHPDQLLGEHMRTPYFKK